MIPIPTLSQSEALALWKKTEREIHDVTPSEALRLWHMNKQASKVAEKKLCSYCRVISKEDRNGNCNYCGAPK